MSFDESTALLGIGIAVGGMILFAIPAILLFVSNARSRSSWKAIVGGLSAFLALSFAATGISPGIAFIESRDQGQQESAPSEAAGDSTDSQTAIDRAATGLDWCSTREGLAATSIEADDIGIIAPLTATQAAELRSILRGQETTLSDRTKALMSGAVRRSMTAYDWDRACRSAATSRGKLVTGAPMTTTTTTRPEPTVIDDTILSDAETVWCATPEGGAGTWLAADALGKIYIGAPMNNAGSLSDSARQALRNVVREGNTGLSRSKHEAFLEEMDSYTTFWWKRACKAAYEAR